MPAAIDSITPGHAQAGDVVTILGSGFGGFGHNVVRVDDGGGPAVVPGSSVTTVDAGTIQVEVPAGLTRDRHVVVEVENTEDSSRASWWLYSRLTDAELVTDRLPTKSPGHREAIGGNNGVPDEDPKTVEAKDFGILSSKVELLPYDLLTGAGDLAPRGQAGLRRLAPGALGERYFSDPDDGAEWRTLEAEPMWWGRQIPAATVTPVFMQGHGDGTTGSLASGGGHVAASAGRLALLNVFNTNDSAGTGSRIIRVEVWLNAAVAFDSDILPLGEDPFLGRGQSWTVAPWLPIAEGDLIRIRLTKSNTTNTLNALARGIVLR